VRNHFHLGDLLWLSSVSWAGSSIHRSSEMPYHTIAGIEILGQLKYRGSGAFKSGHREHSLGGQEVRPKIVETEASIRTGPRLWLIACRLSR